MALGDLAEERLTGSIIGAFYEVYNSLGFGFLERLYVVALAIALEDRGHHIAREISIPVFFNGHELGSQRLDMVVDNKVVIETKSTFEIHDAAHRQLYNYLKSTTLEVGLLLHFGPKPKVFRVVCRNANRNKHRSN